MFRASEQRKPASARILDDPYAQQFLSLPLRAALGAANTLGRLGDAAMLGLRGYVVARHRYMDDAVLASAPFDQLVLLGAGYDTRPWRFQALLKDTPVFEVDHPATGKRRNRIATRHLPALPNRVCVAVDFERESLVTRLKDEGFNSGVRTFVIWEGVSMYLTRATVQGTLRELAGVCGPGSRLTMDFMRFPDSHDWADTFHRAAPQILSALGEPVSFVLHHDDVAGFVDKEGWHLHEGVRASELRNRYPSPQEAMYTPMFVAVLERPGTAE